MINKFEVGEKAIKARPLATVTSGDKRQDPGFMLCQSRCQSRYTKQGDYQPSSQIIVGTETR